MSSAIGNFPAQAPLRRCAAMRKSRSEAAKTRERIVTAAAAEFRQHGIAATGLADLMKAAGLTHGGFYRHFASKDQLVAEACAAAMDSAGEKNRLSRCPGPGNTGLEAILTEYLSKDHRDNLSEGCVLAGLGSELARSDDKTRAAATAGFLTLVDVFARHYRPTNHETATQRALVAVSAMIGAITI